MPKLLSKEKITDSHSTITDSAIIVVNEAGIQKFQKLVSQTLPM